MTEKWINLAFNWNCWSIHFGARTTYNLCTSVFGIWTHLFRYFFPFLSPSMKIDISHNFSVCVSFIYFFVLCTLFSAAGTENFIFMASNAHAYSHSCEHNRMINDFRYLSYGIGYRMASTAISHVNPYSFSVISFSACMQRISNYDSDTHNTKPFKFQIIRL